LSLLKKVGLEINSNGIVVPAFSYKVKVGKLRNISLQRALRFHQWLIKEGLNPKKISLGALELLAQYYFSTYEIHKSINSFLRMTHQIALFEFKLNS